MTPIAEHMHAARRDLAAELELLGTAERVEAMQRSCIENGGSIVPPGRSSWGPHYAEVSNLGVYHSGNDLDEAIRNWIKAVCRIEAEAEFTGAAA